MANYNSSTAAPTYRHGHATKLGGHSKTYKSWHSMLQRCYRVRDRKYPEYGGRGIKVCDRWRDFSNFLTDMGEVPAGLTLDRLDSNGNYEPTNCRWATKNQQSRNKRNSQFIEFDGQRMSVWDWADKVCIKGKTIKKRISSGWTVRDALTIPTGSTKP